MEKGYKGIQKQTLPNGKYAINTEVQDVVIVPTHDITLDWSDKQKPTTNYDANLTAIKLNSMDGFAFSVHLTQVFCIPAENVPMMISRLFSEKTNVDLSSDSSSDNEKFTSIRSLIVRVIEPTVKHHFTACAQKSDLIDFKDKLQQIQKDAVDEIKAALDKYGVEAINTSISQLDLPDDMEEYYRERAKIKEKGKNIESEIETEKIRIQRENLIQVSKNQDDILRSQAEAEIARNQAQANIYFSQAEAESIRQRGTAEASILEAKLSAEVRAMGGFDNYIKRFQIDRISQIKLPNFLSSNGSQSGIMEAILAPVLLGNSHANPALVGNYLEASSANNQPQLPPSLPRCPIVLLLDTSSVMSREYLDQLTEGINTFKEQLNQDKIASQNVEIAVLTFGGSSTIVQRWISNESFSTPRLTLGGQAATGQGIAHALKMVESCKNIYHRNHLQYYQPWIFLITGSVPNDNWQESAKQVQQAVIDKQLKFVTVGVENANIKILNQIAPDQIPPVILENLKFKPLFHWIAFQMKKIIHNQQQENFLKGLAEVVEDAKSSLHPDQAEYLSEHTAGIIQEVYQEQPSRDDYSHHAAELYKLAQQIGGEEGQKILELIPNITKSVKFS
ncbi:MAG: VWA domain-containing protein [Sphaerospermopsis sp. SIO1G2]|nr:VWA domain-containing protein [Sphaerospermopsis sp. SIO1G2]